MFKKIKKEKRKRKKEKKCFVYFENEKGRTKLFGVVKF